MTGGRRRKRSPVLPDERRRGEPFVTVKRKASILSGAMFHVLAAIRSGEVYGIGIAGRVERMTAGRVRLDPATIYAVLMLLLRRRYIRAAAPAPGEEERYRYAVTERGSAALAAAEMAGRQADTAARRLPIRRPAAQDRLAAMANPARRENGSTGRGRRQKREVHRLPPCPRDDRKGLEAWFSAMAAEGLYFSEEVVPRDAATFVRGKPQQVRYRLTPIQNRPPHPDVFTIKTDQELLALMEKEGWSFEGWYGGYCVWGSVEPDSCEPLSDPAVLASALGATVKRRCMEAAVMFLLPLLFLWKLSASWGLLNAFVRLGPIPILLVLLCLCWEGLIPAISAVGLQRGRRLLRGGIPEIGKRSYRRVGLLVRWRLVPVIALVAVLLGAIPHTVRTSQETLFSDYAGEVPAAVEAALAMTNGASQAGDGYVTAWKNVLAPCCFNFFGLYRSEHSLEFDELRIAYYRFSSAWVARLFAEEWLRTEWRGEPLAAETSTVSGVDLVMIDLPGSDITALTLCSGNVVMYVKWTGSAPPLERWAPLLAQSLAE